MGYFYKRPSGPSGSGDETEKKKTLRTSSSSQLLKNFMDAKEGSHQQEGPSPKIVSIIN
jgi:hypothetical protein